VTVSERQSLWLDAHAATPACDAAAPAAVVSSVTVASFVKQQRKQLLTFAGFSGAGYEDATTRLAHAGRVLDARDPRQTLVNIGATAEGIGKVYELAKAKGFTAIGIVSTLARDEGVPLSPCVDHVFFIPDSQWGGRLAGSKHLSPTSAAIVANTTTLVAIGGGDSRLISMSPHQWAAVPCFDPGIWHQPPGSAVASLLPGPPARNGRPQWPARSPGRQEI
jgi:hypothetical protein